MSALKIVSMFIMKRICLKRYETKFVTVPNLFPAPIQISYDVFEKGLGKKKLLTLKNIICQQILGKCKIIYLKCTKVPV